jgi:hypothetical protein
MGWGGQPERGGGIIHKTIVKEQPKLTCKHLKYKQGKIFKVLKDANLLILKNKGNLF